MRIVLDTMGSDNFPTPDVEGAVIAAREYNTTIILVGDEALIKKELTRHNTQGLSMEIVHAPETIAMTDKASQVARTRPQSSIHIGSRLVKDKQADAFVTVGNTGATLTICTLHTLRRIRGIKRPALSSLIRLHGNPMIFIDVGANADTRPEWMVQFALMGSIYAKNALGLDNPGVGVLSNGEEAGKGSELTRTVAQLLENTSLNFIGNVEPKDVLQGRVDVTVCDGFVGNVFLKSLEATAEIIFTIMKDEIYADLRSRIGGAIVKPALKRTYKQIDPFEIGGAPLLGVNGVVIIGHGRSNANGVKNAIRQAIQAVNGKIIEAIHEQLKEIPTTKIND